MFGFGKVLKNKMDFRAKEAETTAFSTGGILAGLTLQQPRQDHPFLSQAHFNHLLHIEKSRTERSRKPFQLLLMDVSELTMKFPQFDPEGDIEAALISLLRETDYRGWYRSERVIGIIFTEVEEKPEVFIEFMMQKIFACFCKKLDPVWLNKIDFTFYYRPDDDQHFRNKKYTVLQQASLIVRFHSELSQTILKTQEGVYS